MNPLAIPQLVWAILMTILGGIIYSILMYGKARQEGEGLDGYKFLRTIIWGILIGCVAFYMGIDFASASDYLYTAVNGYVVILTDQLASAIWRQHGITIQNWLNNLKSEQPKKIKKAKKVKEKESATDKADDESKEPESDKKKEEEE